MWTGFVVDASGEHQLQDRFTRDAAQRDVLLASVSLELRARTHTLSLALKDIRDDALPASSVRSLRIAREAVCTVSQLLDDVLCVARFQTNRLALRPQEFDLHEFTEQVREAHAPMAPAKRLNMTTRAFEPSIRRTNGIELHGLGLSIRRRLVQMMGGTILRSSQASGGTTARVTIPSTGR